jgi:hypothetical protein
MDELWRKVVDTYFSYGREAAIRLLTHMGLSRPDAEGNVQGAMKIYYGTNGNLSTQRRGDGAAAHRSSAQGNYPADRP